MHPFVPQVALHGGLRVLVDEQRRFVRQTVGVREKVVVALHAVQLLAVVESLVAAPLFHVRRTRIVKVARLLVVTGPDHVVPPQPAHRFLMWPYHKSHWHLQPPQKIIDDQLCNP